MINKIMFHINSLGKGGAERVVTTLANEMAKLGKEVIIATEWEAKDEYECDERVTRINVGLTAAEESLKGAKKRSIRKKRLHDAIVSEKPDIIYAFCRNANYRAVLAASGTKTKVVISVRSDPKTDYASKSQKLLSSVLYRKADGAVFQTEEARDFFPEEIRKKSAIILNPLNDKYTKTVLPKTRRKAIVCVGRYHDAKDHMTLLRAFERVHEKYPDYVLELYGDASEDNTIYMVREYIESHKAKERILMLGNSDELEKMIYDAAMYILPSKYEGMPNALMEAMAMGLPVIATDCPCGGPRTLIDDGYNGLLCSVKDDDEMAIAIMKYLENPDKANELGLEAMKIREKAAAESIAKQWLTYGEGL